MDAWTTQAVAASAWLTMLYCRLGDDRMAAMASQSGASCAERAERLGLRARMAAERALVQQQAQADETLAEETAWKQLIQAEAGLCAFIALPSEQGESVGLRGKQTQSLKAFQKALQGYRIAFPEVMTQKGIRQAIDEAATSCAESFVECTVKPATVAEQQARIAALKHSVRVTLAPVIRKSGS